MINNKKNNKHYWLCVIFLMFSSFAFAQFSDDFSDGDFTNNPTWSGDNALFTITSGELNSQSPGAATYYLSTPSTLSANAEWIFDVNLKFSTSGANYVDVFLMADSANLTTVQNGYFVRIGSTQDDIKLYSLVAGTSILLIDGLDGSVNSTSNNPFQIKVTRDASDSWTLLYDDGILGSFTNAGTMADNAVNFSSFFGVLIEQSSAASPINNHFFDNFYCGVIGADITPPSIDSVVVVSANNLDVYFNEVVEINTAQTLTNYSADNGLGNPSSALRDATDSSIVHLTFASAFTNGLTNQLTTINVEDNSGNAIASLMNSFTYVVIIPVGYKDVVINEIFADPTPQIGLPNAEFVELYNASTNPFNLSGWSFINSTTAKTLPNFVLMPNSYVVLCSTTDTALYSPFGDVIGISSFIALTNGGDSLTLTDNNGTIVDIVNYDISWYNDPSKNGGGYTLELINPNHPCSTDKNNWAASNDTTGGTPDSQNSIYDVSIDTIAPLIDSIIVIDANNLAIYFNEVVEINSAQTLTNYSVDNGLGNPSSAIRDNVDSSIVYLTFVTNFSDGLTNQLTITNIEDLCGNTITTIVDPFTYFAPILANYGDVIINEIFADPSPQIGLPNAEFVELYNTSSNTYNVSGWNFINSTIAKTLPNFVLMPNSYVILCSITDTSLYASYGDVIGISSFTALTNGGDSLTLTDNNATILDIVSYDISWYNDPLKDDGGYTLELINPTSPCVSGSGNWSASANADGGTPGTQNSVYDISPDIQAPVIQTVNIISTNQIEVLFNETMDSLSLVNATYGLTGSINVSSIIINANLQGAQLNLDTPLDSSLVYTLTINNATDCSGNIISPNTFDFGIGKAPLQYEIVITELFPDPSPTIGLPEQEYLELYNNTNKIIDLSGCWISDLSSANQIASGKIFPGEYVIICDDNNEGQFIPYGKVISVGSLPSLNNSDEVYSLWDADSNLIHSVHYFDSWYNDVNKKDGGWSLEMIDYNNPCGEQDNWSASTKWFGGTPGSQNSIYASNPDNLLPEIVNANAINDSTVLVAFNEAIQLGSVSIDNGINISTIIVIDSKNIQLNLSNKLQGQIIYTVTVFGAYDCVGNTIGANNSAEFALPEQGNVNDLVINEVLFNPYSGGSDFVELYNKSDKYINLENWKLANLENDSVDNYKIISDSPYLLRPQEFVLLSVNTASIKQFYFNAHEDAFLQMASLPTYSNDEGNVYLINNLDEVVDAFSYNEDMHFALLNSVDGVSLERIDYNRPTNDESNWHSASEAVGFATPGYENSQYLEAETGSEITISPESFSPDNDGFDDVVNIAYQFNEPGYVANIIIYDSKGRLTKNLVKNEYLGTKGTFSWDGINENNEKAAIGIYIIYVEVFSDAGDVKKFKKPCVVAGRLN